MSPSIGTQNCFAEIKGLVFAMPLYSARDQVAGLKTAALSVVLFLLFSLDVLNSDVWLLEKNSKCCVMYATLPHKRSSPPEDEITTDYSMR